MQLSLNPRELKGLAIAELGGQVRRIDQHSYKVKSQSTTEYHDVIASELGWLCSCEDSMYRGSKCKHVFAVEFSVALRKLIEVAKIPSLFDTLACIYCKSTTVVKFGVRHNDNYDVQKFRCNDCRKYFTINVGFAGMRASPQMITSAMQLYFTGESLRNIQKFIKMQGIKISHVAIYKWINKYVALMQKYLEQIKPNVSDTWRADELYVKVKGSMKYLFAIMDDETRFWIAQEVADSKYTHDARNIFRKGNDATGKKPTTIITDGLPAYHDAFNKEYYRMKNPRPQHINAIKFDSKNNNNKMERLNGEIRDREKTMRGIKKVDTKMLIGYQIYHDYIRPHEGLKGKTPAEAAGVTVEGQNKWITLIQNAHQTAVNSRDHKTSS